MIGSPPQVRGKPFLQCKVFLQYRITPAGAGKTAFLLHRCSPPQDHRRRITPAGAGKTENISKMQLKTYGSPPQVRGKLAV